MLLLFTIYFSTSIASATNSGGAKIVTLAFSAA